MRRSDDNQYAVLSGPRWTIVVSADAIRSFVSVGRDNNAPIKPHIRFFSMTRRRRCLSVVVAAFPNPWPLKAQFSPGDRSRCASGSRSGDADSAARLYQVTGLIAQSSSITGEWRFWVNSRHREL
jgi:hypothetical protein